jgi:hypothetical protein
MVSGTKIQYHNRSASGVGVKLLIGLLLALAAMVYGSRTTWAAPSALTGSLTGAITNTVTVGSATFDPNPANNTSVQMTTVTVAASGLPTVTLDATHFVTESNSGLITATLNMTSALPVTVTLVYTDVTANGSDYGSDIDDKRKEDDKGGKKKCKYGGFKFGFLLDGFEEWEFIELIKLKVIGEVLKFFHLGE